MGRRMKVRNACVYRGSPSTENRDRRSFSASSSVVVIMTLLTGSFPSVFKSVVVRLLLKKPSLNTENVKSYRPVSNTPFLS